MKNETNKTTREQIVNKLEPCGCGCHGQDPWHKATYYRTVTQTTPTEGTVKLPYSEAPVRVTRRDLGYSDRLQVQLYGVWIVETRGVNDG